MTTMPGNPHHDTGAWAAELVPSNQEPQDDATVAIAYATLSLAHEQRTANLIAIWQTGDINSDGEVYGILGEKRMEIWREIAERLGFEDRP